MRRWAIGGAVVAVAALVLAFGLVGLLGPRQAPRPARVVSAPVSGPATSSALGSASAVASSQPAATSTWGVSAAEAAEASSVTPIVNVTAPIAVRARHAFTMRGSVTGTSSDETVTVVLERKSGDTWVADKTATVALTPTRTFALSVTPPHGGYLRVTATLAATATHRTGGGQTLVHAVGPKVVALTFDDGPWPYSTQAILRALARADVHATFFELGSQVKRSPAATRRVVAAGDIVEVHSWNHAQFTKRSSAVNRRDLQTTRSVIAKATGVTPVWFRPPYGATNKSVAAATRSAGLKQVLWSIDTLDWKYRNTPSIVTRAMKGVRSGSIILMHDGGGPRRATVNAVPIIIRKLRAQGYDLVTLDEMAALGYKVR